MAIKLDLPASSGGGTVPLLSDPSSRFSIQVLQGKGYVWTEKYYQLKEYFEPLQIKIDEVRDPETDEIITPASWTNSSIRPSFYLVQEQNFRNIGGGFFEWDRLYANVPQTWSETVSMSFNYILARPVSGTVSETSVSTPVSTKIEHSYQLGWPGDLEAQNLKDPVFTVEINLVAAGTPVRPVEVVRYLGDIWEIRKFTTLKSFFTS